MSGKKSIWPHETHAAVKNIPLLTLPYQTIPQETLTVCNARALRAASGLYHKMDRFYGLNIIKRFVLSDSVQFILSIFLSDNFKEKCFRHSIGLDIFESTDLIGDMSRIRNAA